MTSYLVTGGSRGIGVRTLNKFLKSCTLICICQFELLRQLSQIPENLVVTVVRNKAGTETKISAELPGRKNIFVVEGDLTNVDSLKVSQFTKGLRSSSSSNNEGTFLTVIECLH